MDRGTYDRMRELQQRHWWFEGRRRILNGLIADLPLPQKPQILEVGCGPGGNLPMLKAFGDVVAMEPDEASRTYATEQFGVEVKGGLLPRPLPFEPDSFDLVGAFDVIEHVDEDGASVASLAALLKPGGFLATTVPAQPWMWGLHDQLHHHKRRYRMAEYQNLFAIAGLKIRKASFFNTLLFPPIAAVRVYKIISGSLSADDDKLPPPEINRLLMRIFASEGGWLRRRSLPIGVSIVLIAERPIEAAV